MELKPKEEPTKVQQQQEDPKAWIKQNILGGGDFRNDFRQKYFQRLGLRNDSLVAQQLQMLANGNQNNEESKQNNRDQQNQQQTQSQNGQEEKKNPSLVVERTFTHDNLSLNFLVNPKTDDQVRQNYLNKLIKNNILKIQPSKKQQTVIIFDWDDTLLCTTYLGNLGFMDLSMEVNSQINQLDISASNILQKSISYGDCYIVTNAAQGWVEYSSKLYFPKVNELLNQNKIAVISARSGYEEIFPGDCHKWKIEAFKNIKKKYDEHILTNLICLGDSHIEMDAAHALARFFNQVLVKTIKFRENPKPDELVKQQELVGDKFEQIYKNLRNLTIRLEKKASDKN